MKRLNAVLRLTFWLATMFAIVFLSQAQSRDRRTIITTHKEHASGAIHIVDQNGRPAVSGVPSATSQIFDVTVGGGNGFQFVPDTVNISAGDTVRWTWANSGHSVTSGSPCVADSQYCSPDNMNCAAGILSNMGTIYQHTFAQPGTYSYFCFAHCIIGMTGTVNVSGGCVPPPPNMVSWWPGDGNPNDIQDGNNGTLQGGATFAPGEVLQAFSFNGTSSFVNVPEAANLELQTLTIDAWVKPTDLTQERAIVVKSTFGINGNDFEYGLRVLAGGQAEGRITDAQGNFASVVSASVLTLNQFQHIALTYDGEIGRALCRERVLLGV